MQTCIHCGKEFIPNHRIRNQRYCSNKKCQQARKNRWQRKQMAKDAAYRDNQEWSWKRWQAAHKGYMREYRAKHPEYVTRNRYLQGIRDAKKRKDPAGRILVKMDALAKGFNSRRGKLFRLVPEDDRNLVKMDALTVRLIPLATIGNTRRQ